jgi:hypothetical protein
VPLGGGAARSSGAVSVVAPMPAELDFFESNPMTRGTRPLGAREIGADRLVPTSTPERSGSGSTVQALDVSKWAESPIGGLQPQHPWRPLVRGVQLEDAHRVRIRWQRLRGLVPARRS